MKLHRLICAGGYLVVWAVAGCATVDKKSLPSRRASAASQSSQVVAPPTQPAVSEYTGYVMRQGDENQPETPADKALASRIPDQPTPGTAHEAALVVSLLKNALQDSQAALETTTKNRGVDIARALTANPLLKTYGIYRMAYIAAQKPGNTDGFRQRLVIILQGESGLWQALANSLQISQPAAPMAPVAAAPLPGAAEQTLPVDSKAAPVEQPVAEDGRVAETILADAQAFADRSEWEQAVHQAELVPKEHPLYAQAQAQIKVYSDKAVQSLRKKAAQHFQSSIAAGEPNAKKEFLEKARSSLEEALSKYPSATYLSTVKDNLSTINKELERLSNI